MPKSARTLLFPHQPTAPPVPSPEILLITVRNWRVATDAHHRLPSFLGRAERQLTHRGTYVRLVLAAAICVGMFVFFRSAAEPVNNEFFNLYAGASIGPRHLYEPERFAEFARSLHSAVMPARLYYTRMPYFAVFTKPLAGLSFPVALTILRLVQSGGLAASVWLWPGPKTTLGVVKLVSLAAVLVVWFAPDVGMVLCFV